MNSVQNTIVEEVFFNNKVRVFAGSDGKEKFFRIKDLLRIFTKISRVSISPELKLKGSELGFKGSDFYVAKQGVIAIILKSKEPNIPALLEWFLEIEFKLKHSIEIGENNLFNIIGVEESTIEDYCNVETVAVKKSPKPRTVAVRKQSPKTVKPRKPTVKKIVEEPKHLELSEDSSNSNCKVPEIVEEPKPSPSKDLELSEDSSSDEESDCLDEQFVLFKKNGYYVSKLMNSEKIEDYQNRGYEVIATHEKNIFDIINTSDENNIRVVEGKYLQLQKPFTEQNLINLIFE